MRTVIIRSILFAVVAAGFSLLTRTWFHTDQFLDDLGGINNFLAVFGTLYGILAAFVVFEVWSQFNDTSGIIDKEAQGLERLFRLTLYFRDSEMTKKMRKAIHEYASLVIQGKFQTVGSGHRNKETGLAFRRISEVIRDVTFDDDHDSIVFDQILDHYGELGQMRTERLNLSLTRLPSILKAFIYLASGFALIIFIFMPFSTPYYGFFSVFIIGFLMAMIFHIIEDLDNPFNGYWMLTPEPFERALKHIEEDY
jgi:hypothetical protein